MADDLPAAALPERAGEGTSSGGLGHGPGRRRVLVAGAGAGAIVLLVAVLLVARKDDQKTALSLDRPTTSSTDVVTQPDASILPGDAGAPVVPTLPAVPVPGGSGPTTQVASTTTPPTPAPGGGVLVPTFDAVRLPGFESTAGPQRGTLPLRNTGGSPLSYATRSSFAGLTVDKPTGTITPGGAVVLAIALDGSKAPEGRFTGMLTFDGSGGTKQVTVTSTVGRRPVIKDDAGESCATVVKPCSKVIQLVPGSNPDVLPTLCNTPWRYSITVEDESQLKSVRATGNLPGTTADLQKDGATSGPGGRWQSGVFPPLSTAASLDVTIVAVDEFDFSSSRTERRIEC